MTTSVKDAFIASVSFLAMLFLWADMSRAECFVREKIEITTPMPSGAYDLNRVHYTGVHFQNRKEKFLLAGNLYQCVISFDKVTDSGIQQVEKIGWSESKINACRNAEHTKIGFLKRPIDSIDVNHYLGLDMIQQAQIMVCDTNFSRKKYVKVGEAVNLSELHIDERFISKDGDIEFISPVDAPDQTCTIFTEQFNRDDGVSVQNKGYVCMVGSTWTIWKKWETNRYETNVDNIVWDYNNSILK